MDINNLSELKQAMELMKTQMQSTLKNEVKNEIVKTQKKHIDEDVYNEYTPEKYQRTYELKDEKNIIDTSNNANVVEVENITTQESIYGVDKDITQVIETGIGYDYTGFDYGYEEPRPFIENTIEELHESNRLNEVFKNSMKSKGINLE